MEETNYNWKHNHSYLIIGKRGTGKTTNIINNLLPNLKSDKLFIYCNPHDAQNYQHLTINNDINNEPNFEQIMDYITMEDHKNEKKILIFDDVLSNFNFSKSYNFKNLIFNHRHLNTTIIMAVQYGLNIPPDIRANMDYVFLYKDNYDNNKLYERFGGLFQNKEEFNQSMNKLNDYTYIVAYDHVNKIKNPMWGSNFGMDKQKLIDQQKIEANKLLCQLEILYDKIKELEKKN